MKTRLLRYLRWAAKTRVRLYIGSKWKLWVYNPLNPHTPKELPYKINPAAELSFQRRVYIAEFVYRRRLKEMVKELNKKL
jgi:hypothetical protein